MKRGIAALLAIIALGLGGCTLLKVPPSQAQKDSADYGSYDHKQAVSLIQTHARSILIDPYSAVITVDDSHYKGWERAERGDYFFGWWVRYDINAKNVFGGYVGNQRHLAFIRNGEILRTYERNKSNTEWRIARDYLPK